MSKKWAFHSNHNKQKRFTKWSENNVLFFEILKRKIINKVLFLKCWYFWRKKKIFANWSHKDVIYVDMIFLEIWAKRYFQNDLKITSFEILKRKSSKQSPLPQMLIFLEAKKIFSNWSQINVIFVDMIFSEIWAKGYFQSDLKITYFWSKCWF